MVRDVHASKKSDELEANDLLKGLLRQKKWFCAKNLQKSLTSSPSASQGKKRQPTTLLLTEFVLWSCLSLLEF
jgi:hypothetical protein